MKFETSSSDAMGRKIAPAAAPQWRLVAGAGGWQSQLKDWRAHMFFADAEDISSAMIDHADRGAGTKLVGGGRDRRRAE